MNPTSNGLPESPAERRLDEIVNDLDGYAVSLGLPAVLPAEVEVEAKRLLDLTPDQLRRMTGRECGEAAFLLTRFAMHLQNAVNRELARVRWAEESIKKIVAPRLSQQRGTSYEERKLLAVRDNDAATRIDTLRVKAQLRIERINYMSNKGEALARCLMNLRGKE